MKKSIDSVDQARHTIVRSETRWSAIRAATSGLTALPLYSLTMHLNKYASKA